MKAAIVGLGGIAGGYDRIPPDPADPGAWSATHAGAYRLCPDTELVAVADPDPEARRAFREKWTVPGAYAGMDELLDHEDVDVLSLCLPTGHHPRAFMTAIERDVPALFMEKPLASDLADARRMVAAGKGRPVAVNFFRRWNPTFREVKEELEAGTHGRVLSATFRYAKGLLVNGSHHIDTARWLLGEPVGIRGLRNATPGAADPGMDFMFGYDGFAAYFLFVPDAAYVFFDVDIVTEKGRIVFGQRGQTLERHPMVPEPHYGLFDVIGEPEITETQWRDCTTRAVSQLARCLLDGGGTPDCTLDDGLRAVEICHRLMTDPGPD